MTNGIDKCANCGGERGIHHYQTDQCPVGGAEAPIGKEQEYKTSTFLPAHPKAIKPLGSKRTNADEMAYPCQSRWDAGNEAMDLYSDSRGLTKREYFAAMAMQGALANSELDRLFRGATWNPATGDIVPPSRSAQELIAEAAVKQADALIAALNTEAA